MDKLRLLDSDEALDAVLCALPAPVEPRTSASAILSAAAPAAGGARSFLLAPAMPWLKAACLLLVGAAAGVAADRALRPPADPSPAVLAAVDTPTESTLAQPIARPAIDTVAPAASPFADPGPAPAAPRVPVITRTPLVVGGEAPIAPSVPLRPPVDTVVDRLDDRWWDVPPADLVRPAVARVDRLPSVDLDAPPSATADLRPGSTRLRFGGQVVASPMPPGKRAVGPAAQVGVTHLGPARGLSRPMLQAQAEIGGLATRGAPRFLGGVQAGAGIALDGVELRVEAGWLVGVRATPAASDLTGPTDLAPVNLVAGPQVALVVKPKKGPALRLGTAVQASPQRLDDRVALRPWLTFTAGIELPAPRKS